MTYAENFFILASTIVLLFLVIFVKNINWHKFGLKPKNFFQGWWQILVFNFIVFILVQLIIVNKLIVLPDWILDKDPILPLLMIVFLQEILFRGLSISYLERYGKQKALWISVAIFVIFHLIAPYTWSTTGIIFAGLTFAGGYFWGWHFLKFRNVYLLAASHFLVNFSFNFYIIQFLLTK